MIKLTLTEDEADAILMSLHDKLEKLPAYFPSYDVVSSTYHTVHGMVRQQRRVVS
jgi:hypothetical protein